MSTTPWAVSPATRRSMQGNTRSDTSPELRVRSELHRRGLRFRKDHRVDLPDGRVRPDVVFTRAKVAVFIDGCFWHRCPIHGTDPKTNTAYWLPKLQANVDRDRHADTILRAAGWTVVRVWAHQDPDEIAAAVTEAIRVESADERHRANRLGTPGEPSA